MPLTVFDAVGKFSADTTELDRFVVSLERGLTTAEEKAAAAALKNKQAHEALREALKVVSIDGSDTADNMAKLAKAQQEAALAAQAASRAQGNLKQSLGIVKESTRDARGEVGLLGESIGIHLPRHVQTFLAEMPGLQKVLQGAFAVTAVGFLIDALSQLPGKIIEITNSLAGWGKEEQDAYAAQIKLNDHLLELAEKREEQQVREVERGLTGVNLTRQQLADDQKISDIRNKRIADTGAEERGLRQQLAVLEAQRATLDAIATNIPFAGKISGFFTGANDKIKELTKNIAELEAKTQKQGEAKEEIAQQVKDRETQLGQQSLEDSIKFEDAKIEVAKKSADGRVQSNEAAARVLFEQNKISFAQYVDLQATSNQAIFQNDEHALLAKLAQLKRDPTKNKDEIITVNGEIEQLESQHNTKLLTDYANNLTEFKRISNQFANEEFKLRASPVFSPPRNILDSYKTLEAALRSLGITSGVEIGRTAQIQQNEIGKINQAYDELIKHAKSAADAEALTGERTAVIDQANRQARLEEINQLIALLNLEITVGNRKHQNVQKEEADLKALKKERQDLQRVEQKYGQNAMQIAQAVAGAVQSEAAAWASGQVTIVGAIAGIAAAIINGIASIADKKGAEATAEAFGDLGDHDYAAAANHFAAATGWFALGGALTAGATLAGNVGQKGNSGTSGSASEAAIPAQLAQPAQNPVQTVNAQHFAGGGLISSPTLAVIGDSIRGSGQREAAIPLDDPQAVEAIVEALGGGTGTVIHNHIKGVISGDNLTKVMRKMSRSVIKGQARLTANTSYKVTRKA
jgi:hypothetical protein